MNKVVGSVFRVEFVFPMFRISTYIQYTSSNMKLETGNSKPSTDFRVLDPGFYQR